MNSLNYAHINTDYLNKNLIADDTNTQWSSPTLYINFNDYHYFTQKSYTVLKVFSVTTNRVIETKTLKNGSKIINLITRTLSPTLQKNLSHTLHGRKFIVGPFKSQ